VESKIIKAVVLAAGKGTRMKSNCPKVLHKIMGKTILERTLESIRDIHTSEIFLIIGHQADLVKEKVQNFDLDTKLTCIMQNKQLGTGHAVYQVFNELINFEGTILVICGDTPLLTKNTISKFVIEHSTTASALSILSTKVKNPVNYGRIVRGMEGSVRKIVEEKDATISEKKINEINTGVYCIEWQKIAPAFLELNSNNAQGEYYLTDIVEWATTRELNVNAHMLAEESEIFGINSRADISTATMLLNIKKIEQLMASGVTIVDPSNTWISDETEIEPDCTILPGCYIEGANYIKSNTVIGPNVYISGNVHIGFECNVTMSKLSKTIIGDHCTIGPFAHLRDQVIIDNNVRIGNFVEVKKSKIKCNTNAAHLSYIGDSELGSEVNIGAGTITANYDSLLKVKNKTVLKDKVKIGSNTVLVAPVTINEGANVAAGSVITKDVPEYSLAIARGRQAIIDDWVNKKLKEKENIHI